MPALEWTEAQKEAIVGEYWRDATPLCPSDKSRLKAEFVGVFRGSYILRVSCRVCGQAAELGKAHDPLREAFREWTPEEEERIRVDFLAGRISKCPVCHAVVSVGRKAPLRGPSTLHCHCPRCDSFAELDAGGK